MDRNKVIENEIISRCNMAIILLTILDVIVILFFFITFTINIVAVLITAFLIITITLLIMFFKKVKKEPLKYKKYFLNLEVDHMDAALSEEMQKRQQMADEINSNYELKIGTITFSDNDNLRIEKNCKVMESMGLPYMKEMKLVPLDSNVKIKSKEEIVMQMIFDFFLSHKAKNKLMNISDIEDVNIMSLAMKYPIKEMFDVLSQISKGEIDDVTLYQISYLGEQANVFVWVLGFRDKPSEIQLSDDNILYQLLSSSKDFNDIVDKSNMISYEEIMEYADLITRYEWAMIELRRTNKNSDKINKDCILEHKRAVDFLTSYVQPVSMQKK